MPQLRGQFTTLCWFTPTCRQHAYQQLQHKVSQVTAYGDFRRHTTGNSRNDRAFLHILYTEPTDSLVNVTQTHLTRPGQAELSNISDRQNKVITSRNESKRIPYRKTAPAQNTPTLPATLLSGLINYATSPWYTGRAPDQLRSVSSNRVQFGSHARGPINYAISQYKFAAFREVL